ncbi:MAG: acyl-CoA dehydrogenase [Alphaproteobacteria bacterium]|nr:acyl-CoA dehydrogenase [Alphaproteobacteria bacterium]
MTFASYRRERLSRPIFKWARHALPAMSETEREALEAGDVWWDAELFTGSPDWRRLLEVPPATLNEREQAFLDGPVENLCRQLDDWRINWEWRDLPPEIWAFLKEHRFFGMIIAEDYGGLGFSAFAHSEVVRKISSRSITAAVTVMVPNSLGPGELLHQFGTEAQKAQWLPRLADGREIPCFGLTSPEAGSDAAAMEDRGVVCRAEHEGEEVLGIRLDWHKRYITLGPVATVLGLAFKLYDPDHLLGEKEELGITVALIPTDTPGVEIGRRHLPSYQTFQNGPNWGRDVFAPIDWVIGGQDRVGQGWNMLMSALAAGRGISLPSLSAAGAAFSARTTGAYARVRQQFGIPIGKFEGVGRRLARIGATAYQLDAARRLTCAGLDQGRKLAVISAIMKAHATNRMREAVDDAMDVHAGKAIIDGPLNYLGNLYRAVPVGITVEGANILTRNLIIFGQGAIRCHPYLLEEMLSLEDPDPEAALDRFDAAFWAHVGHSVKTAGRAWLRNWSGGLLAPGAKAGPAARHYRQLSRYAAAFALLSDLTLLTLGGALKRKELISARLGDILSELYLLSAVCKRFEDDGRPRADQPLVDYCLAAGIATIEVRFAEVLDNLPNRPAAWAAKFLAQPLGPRRRGPSDALVLQCADLLLAPSESRDRLTANLFLGAGDDGVALLERAFDLEVEVDPLRRKLRRVGNENLDEAVEQGLVTEAEAKRLAEADRAVAAVIEVDDFAPEDLSPLTDS